MDEIIENEIENQNEIQDEIQDQNVESEKIDFESLIEPEPEKKRGRPQKDQNSYYMRTKEDRERKKRIKETSNLLKSTIKTFGNMICEAYQVEPLEPDEVNLLSDDLAQIVDKYAPAFFEKLSIELKTIADVTGIVLKRVKVND